MNHPFPRNLPLLREIYLGRFSELRFLVPFERLDDRDVITVYRGSYTHAGYITDARKELGEIDCDYFIFCHDDVLLNPQLNEHRFPELFPIGPNDGFISRVGALPAYIGVWDWYFGLIPKMFYPKSLLFGSGIEFPSVVKHLPPRSLVERKLSEGGVEYSDEIRFSEKDFDQVEAHPSRLVLHGHYMAVNASDPRQVEVEALSLNICRELSRALKLSAEITGVERDTPDGEKAVKLPIPLIGGAFYTDLYILPKSRLDDYAHYVGVASAANLFVEVLAPTLLYTCCDRVWNAKELDLDDSGFERQPTVDAFVDPRLLAIHPFKMSTLSPVGKRELLAQLREIAGEADPQIPVAQPGGLDGSLFDLTSDYAEGWHAPEAWGSWAAKPLATVKFHYDPSFSLRNAKVHLSIPMHSKLGRFSGRVALNGVEQSVTAEWPTTTFEVEFQASHLRSDAPNLLEIRTDRMLRPPELDAKLANDARSIGLGLRGITFA